MSTTILVIDDSADDQRLYQRAFKNSDYVLEMLSTADAGFLRLAGESNASAQLCSPDLILLDYNLPDMDGLSFMKRLSESMAPPLPLLCLPGKAAQK